MFGKPSFGKPPGSTQDWYLTKQPAGQPKQPSGNTQYAGGTPNLSGRPVAPGRAQSQQQPSAGTPYGAYATPSSQTTGDPRGAYATAPPSQRPPPIQMGAAQTPWGQSMDPFAERDAFVNQIGQQRINNQIAFNTSGPQAPQGSPFINYDMARQNASLAGGAPSMNANPADTFIGRFNNQYGSPINPGFGGGQSQQAYYPGGPGGFPTQPARPGPQYDFPPPGQGPVAYYPGGPGGFPTQPARPGSAQPIAQPQQGTPYAPASGPSEGATRTDPSTGKPVKYENGQWSWRPNPVSGIQPYDPSRFGDGPTQGAAPPAGPAWSIPPQHRAEYSKYLESQGPRIMLYDPVRDRQAYEQWAASTGRATGYNPGMPGQQPVSGPAAPAPTSSPAVPPSPAPGSQPQRGRSADIRSPDEIAAEAKTKASQESPEWKAAVEASRPGRAQPIAPPSQGDPYAVGDLTKLPFYKSLMVGDTVRLNEHGQYNVFDSAGRNVQQYGNASQGNKLIGQLTGGRTGNTIWGSTPEGAAEQAADLKRLEERDRPIKEAAQKEAASKIARLDELRKKQHQWAKSSASTGAGGRGLVKGRDGKYVTPWNDEYWDLINWSSKAQYDPNLTPQQRGLIEGWFPNTKVAGNRAYY